MRIRARHRKVRENPEATGLQTLIRQLNIPVGQIDEVFPRFVAGLAELEMEHGPPLGPARLVQELEARLGRRAVALAAVARDAGADNVFPRGLTAAVARDDVVEVEILPVELLAAVLAGVVVALKDVVPRELDLLLRHAVEEEQEDYFRYADLE